MAPDNALELGSCFFIPLQFLPLFGVNSKSVCPSINVHLSQQLELYIHKPNLNSTLVNFPHGHPLYLKNNSFLDLWIQNLAKDSN